MANEESKETQSFSDEQVVHKNTNAKRPIRNVERILDINLELIVKIGTLRMRLKDVLDLHPGSILEITKNTEEPLGLSIGEKELARGEVVTIGENLGLRILQK